MPSCTIVIAQHHPEQKRSSHRSQGDQTELPAEHGTDIDVRQLPQVEVSVRVEQGPLQSSDVIEELKGIGKRLSCEDTELFAPDLPPADTHTAFLSP